MEKKLQKFIEKHEKKVISLSKDAALAYYTASISGKSADYEEAADLELKLNKIYANKKEFAELKQIKESNSVKDPLLKRQLDILYNDYLSKQIDEKLLEEIIKLQTANENIYATHRVKVNGKTYTDNDIDKILKASINSEELKKFWMASKEIGKVVESDILKLINLRNQSARQLGFDNYHTMMLLLSEQDPAEIDLIFEKLDELIREPYKKLKIEIDKYLSKRIGIKTADLMPWHYQNKFFQEAPEIFDTELDKYFIHKDIEKITIKYFATIGLPINEMIQNSDLYEKENKYQHAYCINIDRSGDIRVICNIKPNANWMGTMLHEFGHAVYDKYVDPSMPWLLRTHAHIFTTESIAMFFGRLASNLKWIEKFVEKNIENKETLEKNIDKNLKLNLMVFSRWVLVMFHFEKQMYNNPDQDLNALWWDLVEKYQGLKKPSYRNEPDWASKIHVALYPAYYHNYMLGELLASQIQDYLVKTTGSYFDGKGIGKYLKGNIFNPGSKFNWNELIRKATGEPLNPAYFVKHIL